MFIYVSGPLSNGDVEANVKEAMRVGGILMEKGFFPFVPHLNHYIEPMVTLGYEDWMRYDLAWLRKCNALIRLPGESPGGDREVALATQLWIPVFYGLDEFLGAPLDLGLPTPANQRFSLPVVK